MSQTADKLSGVYQTDQELNKEQTQVKKCEECMIDLVFGVAFFTFACHFHKVCGNCYDNLKIKHAECCYCKKEAEEIETRKKRRTMEDKNTLPLLYPAHTGGVLAGAAHLKYDYPSQFRRSAPVHVISKQFKEMNLRLEITDINCYKGLFSTPYPDTIVACDPTSPFLHVLTSDGSVISHRLSEGDRIYTATFITPTQYLLCTGYHDGSYLFDYNRNYTYKLNIINLDIRSMASTKVTPHSLPLLMTEIRHPIQVFNICRQRYGVLCSREYRKVKGTYDSGEADTYRMNIIHVLTLDILTLHTDRHLAHSVQYTDQARHMIQSNVLWGRRTIRLEGSNGDLRNTVCVAPGAGYFCLAVYMDYPIRMYSRTGLFLCTLSPPIPVPSLTSTLLTAGALRLALLWVQNGTRAIMCTGSGDLMKMLGVNVFTPRTSSWRCNHGQRGDDRYGHWDELVLAREELGEMEAYNSVLSDIHMWCLEYEKRDGKVRDDGIVVDSQGARNSVYKVRVYNVQYD